MRDFQSNVPMQGCKIELVAPKGVYLEGRPHGFNMLAVKDPKTVKDPLFRLLKQVSPKLLMHKNPNSTGRKNGAKEEALLIKR